MNILNCAVSGALWERWSAQFAPSVQPFYVSDELALRLPPLPRWTRAEFRALQLPLTFTDTFQAYAVSPDASWVFLLGEDAYRALPPTLRAALLREQRRHRRGLVEELNEGPVGAPGLRDLCAPFADDGLFVWWPRLWQTLSPAARQNILVGFVTDDRLPHCGDHLTPSHWPRVRQVLPGVEPLAGTFADQSGPNCLSTALAALGVPGVADLWLHGGPFERWVQAMTVDSSEVDVLGTLLVWRDAAGQVQHAAVALGEGWVFHKEAQNWWAPRQIVPLEATLQRWDEPAWTVTPHVLKA